MSPSLRMPSPRSRTLRASVAIGLAVLGGCAHQDPPGVNAQAISANLVFGVKEKPRDAKPAAALPVIQPVDAPVAVAPARVVNPTAAGGVVELPPQDFPAAPVAGRLVAPPIRAPKAAVACPAAAANAFPQIGTQLTPAPTSRPELGSYRWKRTGTLTNKATSVQLPIGGLEERKLLNLKELGDSVNTSPVRGTPAQDNPAFVPAEAGKVFSFEQVQTSPIDGSLVTTTFKVDTFSAAAGNSVNGTGVTFRNGNPERGVVIKSISNKATDGTAATFNPPVGLLLLPLPVLSGEEFTSATSDPVSGLAYAYQAKVTKRDTVDACGEIIEGWRVDGTMTISGTTQTTEKASYIFAPQYGALPLYERVEVEDATAKLVYEANIGQLHPGTPPTAK